ncbi:MAG: methyltransferase domain-containing protein [Silicimonas sp.]|nr:methyltransferase domain-containing protein [Silicimonas sp.]
MSGANSLTALDRYRTHAERLGRRFLNLDAETVLEAVLSFLPTEPVPVLDVGAGSGRDALWFAEKGHEVTAVEPVREMSEQAEKTRFRDRIHWIEDHLPGLEALDGHEGRYGLALLSGVWHHLPPEIRAPAFTRLAGLLRPEGRLVLSLRLGPDVDGRTNFAIDLEHTLTEARAAGLDLVHKAERPSIQAANIALGVTWVWLVLDRCSAPQTGPTQGE